MEAAKGDPRINIVIFGFEHSARNLQGVKKMLTVFDQSFNRGVDNLVYFESAMATRLDAQRDEARIIQEGFETALMIRAFREARLLMSSGQAYNWVRDVRYNLGFQLAVKNHVVPFDCIATTYLGMGLSDLSRSKPLKARYEAADEAVIDKEKGLKKEWDQITQEQSRAVDNRDIDGVLNCALLKENKMAEITALRHTDVIIPDIADIISQMADKKTSGTIVLPYGLYHLSMDEQMGSNPVVAENAAITLVPSRKIAPWEDRAISRERAGKTNLDPGDLLRAFTYHRSMDILGFLASDQETVYDFAENYETFSERVIDTVANTSEADIIDYLTIKNGEEHPFHSKITGLLTVSES